MPLSHILSLNCGTIFSLCNYYFCYIKISSVKNGSTHILTQPSQLFAYTIKSFVMCCYVFFLKSNFAINFPSSCKNVYFTKNNIGKKGNSQRDCIYFRIDLKLWAYLICDVENYVLVVFSCLCYVYAKGEINVCVGVLSSRLVEVLCLVPDVRN